MSRITKNSEERREEIIQAAFDLFCKHGYKDMKMKDVATELNVAHGLVYHYFSSKEDLFDAVIETFYEEKLVEVHEILSHDLTPHEKLKGIFSMADTNTNHLTSFDESYP